MVDKPNVAMRTKADEISMNIRPYLHFYSPLDVTDFEFAPTYTGEYELTWFECQEQYNTRDGEVKIVRQWTNEKIVTVKTIADTITENKTVTNLLGRIPVTPHYNKKPLERGLSTSDLQDIAGMQISIYNDLSELAQMIRGSNFAFRRCSGAYRVAYCYRQENRNDQPHGAFDAGTHLPQADHFRRRHGNGVSNIEYPAC